MTTFDVHSAAGDTGNHHQQAADPGFSTLDLLREVSSAVVEFEPYVFENPLGLVRFTCRTDVPNNELQRWQRAALPPKSGRQSGVPDLSKLDAFRLYARALADTCERVEIRRGTDQPYVVVADGEGTPLTFDDREFLGSLGTPDKLIAVKKLMAGSEAYLINRGQELLEKAGYGDEADSEDPLD
jgi:hypothetical protein